MHFCNLSTAALQMKSCLGPILATQQINKIVYYVNVEHRGASVSEVATRRQHNAAAPSS